MHLIKLGDSSETWDSVVVTWNKYFKCCFLKEYFYVKLVRWMMWHYVKRLTLRPFWAAEASIHLCFGLSYPGLSHQDNEQDLQWCLSWLTELCKSTPSKRQVCHAWVHLLLKTNMHLKAKFLVLLADESAMLMKTVKASEYKLIVSSPHCHHLVVIVQPLCSQNNWVIFTRHRNSKLQIYYSKD